MPFSLWGGSIAATAAAETFNIIFLKSTKVGASDVSYGLKPLLCVSLMTCKFDPRNYVKIEVENLLHKSVL